MILTVNILKELDEKIEEDFDNYPPKGIPRDHEWQMSGLGELFFNSEKKKKASQRTVFNFGVMTGLASYHFDGKSNEFDKFLKKAVFSAVQSPKMVMNAQKFSDKFSKEFSTGVKWSTQFRERYDLSENQDDTHKIDDSIYSVENKINYNNKWIILSLILLSILIDRYFNGPLSIIINSINNGFTSRLEVFSMYATPAVVYVFFSGLIPLSQGWKKYFSNTLKILSCFFILSLFLIFLQSISNYLFTYPRCAFLYECFDVMRQNLR
jgi:hypothetical protein